MDFSTSRANQRQALESLGLVEGQNTIKFVCGGDRENFVEAHLFVWRALPFPPPAREPPPLRAPDSPIELSRAAHAKPNTAR